MCFVQCISRRGMTPLRRQGYNDCLWCLLVEQKASLIFMGWSTTATRGKSSRSVVASVLAYDSMTILFALFDASFRRMPAKLMPTVVFFQAKM